MVDLLCAFVAMLASAAFAQFGVTLKSQTQASQPEVHRTVQDRAHQQPATGLAPGAGSLRLTAPTMPPPRMPVIGQKGG